MHTIYAILTLKDDTILTSTNKSTEVAPSLSHIPGRQILGCVASRLYAGANAESRWGIFHGGAVRFFDAVPCIVSGEQIERGFMSPLSYHHEKGCRGSVGGRLTDKVYNLFEEYRGTQFKQLRGQYITKNGVEVAVHKRSSMRVSLENGRAKDGLLFGYHAVSRGTTFLAKIEVQEAGYRQGILTALGTEIRIGRSKTAEYGRVRVEVVNIPDQPVAYQDGTSQEISFYCASDVALSNSFGMPSVALKDFATAVGGVECVLEKTFVRTRTYSPFHGFRCRPDGERQVIVRGSVIVVRFASSQDREALRKKLKTGVGLHSHEGLGEVWVDPVFLRDAHPFAQNVPQDTSVGSTGPKKADFAGAPVELAWLQGQYDQAYLELDVLKRAKNWRTTLEGEFGAKSLKRITPSQWGQIRAYAKSFPDRQTLLKHLTGLDATNATVQEDVGFLFSGQRKLRTQWGYRSSEYGETIAKSFLKLMQNEQLPLGDVLFAFAKLMQSRQESAQ